MLPRDLEDWLYEIVGDQVVKKEAVYGYNALATLEREVFEVWLFDAEVTNGGVLQYFFNHGKKRWNALLKVAKNPGLPTLADFVQQVQKLLPGERNIVKAVEEVADNLDALYDQRQSQIVRELKSRVDACPDLPSTLIKSARKTAPCPYCGKPLRTPMAKQCHHCKMDWHNPDNVHTYGGHKQTAPPPSPEPGGP